MKKYIFVLVIVFATSCTSTSNQEPQLLCPTENLGLNVNNSFPDYPSTWMFLSNNVWYKQTIGDTLKISHTEYSDDDGYEITYNFLARKNTCLSLLNVKYYYHDGMIYNNGTVNNNNFGSTNQPISFQVQEYNSNGILACKIKTNVQIGSTMFMPMEDKIWINLGN